MRFDLDMGDENTNTIHSYQSGKIKINDDYYESSLIITPEKLIQNWQPQQITDLTSKHCQEIVALNPELILIGTGEELIFPESSIVKPIVLAKIGVEFMTTAAACRTYNVLMAEGRNLAAALII